MRPGHIHFCVRLVVHQRDRYSCSSAQQSRFLSPVRVDHKRGVVLWDQQQDRDCVSSPHMVLAGKRKSTGRCVARPAWTTKEPFPIYDSLSPYSNATTSSEQCVCLFAQCCCKLTSWPCVTLGASRAPSETTLFSPSTGLQGLCSSQNGGADTLSDPAPILNPSLWLRHSQGKFSSSPIPSSFGYDSCRSIDRSGWTNVRGPGNAEVTQYS